MTTDERQMTAALAGLSDRLDRLFLMAQDGERFILSTDSARNIVEIVREWLRTRLPSQAQAAEWQDIANAARKCVQVWQEAPYGVSFGRFMEQALSELDGTLAKLPAPPVIAEKREVKS